MKLFIKFIEVLLWLPFLIIGFMYGFIKDGIIAGLNIYEIIHKWLGEI